MRVRILVIGSGAREHAILVALAADPAVTALHAAPGNPGMVQATCHDVSVTDPAAVTAMLPLLRGARVRTRDEQLRAEREAQAGLIAARFEAARRAGGE